MKKILAVSLVFVFCVGLWFWGYYSRKSNDNIPSKELMVSYCQNNGEDYAAEQLQGYKNTQLMEVWGEPDGSLFGFWGDIWEANDTYNIIVYYDSDGIVEHVMARSKEAVSFMGVNAVILEINADQQQITVKGTDKDSILGESCPISCKHMEMIYCHYESGETQQITIQDLQVGDEITLHIRESEIQAFIENKDIMNAEQLQLATQRLN